MSHCWLLDWRRGRRAGRVSPAWSANTRRIWRLQHGDYARRAKPCIQPPGETSSRSVSPLFGTAYTTDIRHISESNWDCTDTSLLIILQRNLGQKVDGPVFFSTCFEAVCLIRMHWNFSYPVEHHLTIYSLTVRLSDLFCLSFYDVCHIIIIIIAMTMFMVLSSWPKSLREFTRFIWRT